VTSSCVTAAEGIAEVWAALTPPRNPAVKYRRIGALTAAAPRAFYFEPPVALAETDIGAGMRVVRYQLVAVVRLDVSSENLTTIFEDRLNEGALLEGSVETNPAWGAGVRAITVRGSAPRVTDDDQLDLVIRFDVVCEETDR